MPQTPNLNRGIWKVNETKIREWSQTDSLYIICGGYYENNKIGNIAVPIYCWKVVESLTTKKVLFCGWFGNTNPATEVDVTVEELEKKLKYKISLSY